MNLPQCLTSALWRLTLNGRMLDVINLTVIDSFSARRHLLELGNPLNRFYSIRYSIISNIFELKRVDVKAFTSVHLYFGLKLWPTINHIPRYLFIYLLQTKNFLE